MTTQKQQDLQAALKRLDAARHAPEGQPQRRFQRFSVRSIARLWPGHADSNPAPPNEVQVRDISRGGIGFLASEPLPLGRFWQLQMLDSGVTIATVPAYCRHCHKIMEGAYLIGAEFGVPANILLSLGVTADEIAHADEAEAHNNLTGDFVSPDRV